MKLAICALVPGLLISVILLSPAFASTPRAQESGRLYGKATLLPTFGSPHGIGVDPHGTALFYKVGDASNSTRVVIRLENMIPNLQITPGITAGACQGSGVAPLNAMTTDRFGNAQATTVLTGQQVSLGQWYVLVQFCDMLNPDQVCSVCGKVYQVGSISAGASSNLPETGSSSREVMEFAVLLMIALLSLAIGAYFRHTQTRRASDD